MLFQFMDRWVKGGSIKSFLEVLENAYVGCGILASSVAMGRSTKTGLESAEGSAKFHM